MRGRLLAGPGGGGVFSGAERIALWTARRTLCRSWSARWNFWPQPRPEAAQLISPPVSLHHSLSSTSTHLSSYKMQRPSYGPAQSPPLHHPVPQHVSTVPQLRSPPPPQPPSQPQSGYGGYGDGGNAAGGGSYSHPAFGGFMNEGTAQMAFNLAKNAGLGQEYIDQNVCWIQTSPISQTLGRATCAFSCLRQLLTCNANASLN